MERKALFVTIIIVLVVATVGTYLVWEKKDIEVPRPVVTNEPQPTIEPTAGPFPFAERVIDPATEWVLFSQPEYVPISFLYPPKFEQTGAHRFEWGGVLLDFQSDQYLLQITIAGDGKGLPPSIEYSTTVFSLNNEIFSIDLFEEEDAPPNLFAGWAQNVPGGKNTIEAALGLPTGSSGLWLRMSCKPISFCPREESRGTFKQVVSSIRLASDSR